MVINSTDISFYLEAICPDSLPNPKNFDSVAKRIEKSIQKKNSKYNEWGHKKIITLDKAYVIFIGLYGMDSSIIPINSYRNHLLKVLNEKFNATGYSHVSAVVISNSCDQLAMTYGEMKLFNDMILIHNLNATTPLPIKTISVHQEYHGWDLKQNAIC